MGRETGRLRGKKITDNLNRKSSVELMNSIERIEIFGESDHQHLLVQHMIMMKRQFALVSCPFICLANLYLTNEWITNQSKLFSLLKTKNDFSCESKRTQDQSSKYWFLYKSFYTRQDLYVLLNDSKKKGEKIPGVHNIKIQKFHCKHKAAYIKKNIKCDENINER